MTDFALGEISSRVIGAAIAVHTALGPGFVESVYEASLAVELTRRDIRFERQVLVAIEYSGVEVGAHRLDLLVAGEVVVELRAASDISSVHRAQLASYLKASGRPVGLLLNFGRETLQIRSQDQRAA